LNQQKNRPAQAAAQKGPCLLLEINVCKETKHIG